MCGLVLLTGPHSEQQISYCTARIRHRGPDEQNIHIEENIAIGFQRLAINGEQLNGRQPFEHKGWLSAINGEIYNYQELEEQYKVSSHSCDTRTVLPLYLQLKNKVIDKLDGFYAAVLIPPSRTHAICLRDPMGKKPLFVGKSNGNVFISSELKSMESIDWFEAIPKGICSVDFRSGKVSLLQKPIPKRNRVTLTNALTKSVQKRLPSPHQPVAVFLSGGLDSSIIASITSRLRNDTVYFTLGTTNNTETNDSSAAELVAKYLKLKNVITVPLPTEAELPCLIEKTVFATESYNPSIISNGLATYLLAGAARNLGIKVVLTGEGADELFGGYHQFLEHEPWRETRTQLINDMAFTELRRLDMACMANGIEPRCPFLDETVKALSDKMSFKDLYNAEQNKLVLRRAFKGYLPTEVLQRKKISCDVGSGIRGMVVKYLKQDNLSERDALLKIWKKHFDFDPLQYYFHSYPAFDAVIDIRGSTHR